MRFVGGAQILAAVSHHAHFELEPIWIGQRFLNRNTFPFAWNSVSVASLLEEVGVKQWSFDLVGEVVVARVAHDTTWKNVLSVAKRFRNNVFDGCEGSRCGLAEYALVWWIHHESSEVWRYWSSATKDTNPGAMFALAHNADGHGIVPDGFQLKIEGGAQFPCTVLFK